MPDRTGQIGSRRSRGAGERRRILRWLRLAAIVVGGGAFAAGFAAAGYVVKLDRVVRERFEGQRFRVPSRVYSAPSILYPGLDWKLVDLEGTLLRLGYRKVLTSEELEQGRYLWGPGRVRVYLRSFHHPSRPEPAHDVVLRLDGRQIEQILELPSGQELGAVMLEPEPIGAYYGPDREQRELVKVDEVPRHLVDAIVAVEDQRFESHHGIDPRRIAGALLANLRAGRVAQGGSTLTQQLVKNFFLTPERTLRRKLQEGAMALIVEARYDKSQILQAYLNEIYLGQRGATAVHGVGEAARLYYGKPVADLSVAESALLAAIIQSPNGKSPYRDPERAVERRNLVLELMYRQGRLTESEWRQARQEPLRLAAITPDAGDARYFLDLLQRQLASAYSSDVLQSEGLRIFSISSMPRRRAPAGHRGDREELPGAARRGSEGRAPGLHPRAAPPDGRGHRARRRPRLRALTVRPLHPGEAPDGELVQAVRVHRRARAGRRGADRHARDGPRRLAARGADAERPLAPGELRPRVPRLGPAA